jgi:hypothetical protein
MWNEHPLITCPFNLIAVLARPLPGFLMVTPKCLKELKQDVYENEINIVNIPRYIKLYIFVFTNKFRSSERIPLKAYTKRSS